MAIHQPILGCDQPVPAAVASLPRQLKEEVETNRVALAQLERRVQRMRVGTEHGGGRISSLEMGDILSHV